MTKVNIPRSLNDSNAVSVRMAFSSDKLTMKLCVSVCCSTQWKSSIKSADKKFICLDMPAVAKYLHCRLIDMFDPQGAVSAMVSGYLGQAPKNKMAHRAKESIQELK